MIRIPTLTLLCIIAVFCLSVIPVHATSDTSAPIIIAAGAEAGNYLKLARVIQQRAAARDIHVIVLTTNGSVENVELLEKKQANFAFVQSDVFQRALRGHLPFADPIKDMRLVTPLFAEVVQILVRWELYVFSVEELRGKVVSFGPKGSGTEQTARAIVEASGVSLREIDQESSALEDTDRKLQDEDVDAIFLASSVPSPIVNRSLRAGDARLLRLGAKIIDRLSKAGSYVSTVIPQNTYPNQPDEIPTVGVEALLITREDCDPRAISLILQLMQSDQKELEQATGLHLNSHGNIGTFDSSLPIHPAAKPYLRSETTSWLTLSGITVLFLAALGFIFWKQRHIRSTLVDRKEVLLATSVLAIVWVLGAGGLFFFERHINENFESFLGAMWSMVVYIAGGFQTRRPITHNGEVVAVVSIVVGVGVSAWFVAELAGHFVKGKLEFLEYLLIGGNKVPESLEGHIVIVNWDHRAEFMIRQLHGADVEKQVPIVVVARDPVRFPHDPVFHDSLSVVGDPNDTECLKKARITKAHSVTILSAWTTTEGNERRKTLDVDAADAKTILTVLAIRALTSEKQSRSDLPITAEIRSSRNVSAAQTAGRGGPTEIICVEHFGAAILTQCAFTPGLASLYGDLLTFAPGTDEIYRIPVPSNCVGQTFSQALVQFAADRQKKVRAIPIGVYRDRKIHVNPADDDIELGLLQSGDFLFVITDTA
jgi:uncharacterized protein